MTAFMTACIFVVLAEMGDKTQLLAMAFATKYNWKTVMAGVFAATVLNHLFAVAVGSYLTEFVPMSTISWPLPFRLLFSVCGPSAAINLKAKTKSAA